MEIERVNTILRVKNIRDGVIGFEIELPDAPPLILIRGRKGFIMCGYINLDVAEKLGLVVVRVSGVSSIEEMLEKEVSEATSRAKEIGIKAGVKVKDIIDLI
ncbi:MAG: DUF1805 domain-containing protein [Thermoprotei archaeon]|nr:MAG: DUF1805 domain-containing protein [Thermoprotei archaeon]